MRDKQPSALKTEEKEHLLETWEGDGEKNKLDPERRLMGRQSLCRGPG